MVDRTELPEGYEVQLDNLVYERADLQGRQSEAHTARAQLSPRSGASRFERIELQQRVEASGGQVRIVAGQGEANLYSGKLNLRDGVRIADGEGRVLDAPSAAYDPDEGVLAGSGPATLRGVNFVLRSEQGYVVDAEAEAVELLGPVHGFVDPLTDASAKPGQP